MILLQTALLLLLYGEGWGYRLPQVIAPQTWRLGVPESVIIRAPPQSESFPVTVSVMSHPDKTTVFSSALLRLTPENRFRGSVGLSITAEDSPGEFVDLVVESGAFRKEMRIPVTGAARSPRNQPDKTAVRRRRRRSELTEQQIKELTSKFKIPFFQQCCFAGINHYYLHYTCKKESNEELNRTRPKCYMTYELCCYSTEEKLRYKPIGMAGRRKKSLEIIEHIVFPPPIFGSPASTPQQIAAIRTPEEEEVIVIRVTQTTGRGTVTSTFTVKIDPTEDVSVELSDKMYETNIVLPSMTPPPADGDQ